MQHFFRETNKAADLLVKLGCYQVESFVSNVTTFIVMEALAYDSNVVTCTLLIRAPPANTLQQNVISVTNKGLVFCR